MFAVIKTGGKQYKVAAEDTLQIERLVGEAGDSVTFDNVLMVGSGADVTIGAPLVDGATVIAELVEQTRGKTIKVFKKRRRQNSRRTIGHRHHFSIVKITDILTGGKKPAAKKAAPKKAAAPAAEKPAKAAKAQAAPASAEIIDDLKLISGVGPALEKKLHDAGVTSLKDVSEFTAADIARVDEVLSFKGRIEREEWVQQAKDLLAGKPPRAKSAKK